MKALVLRALGVLVLAAVALGVGGVSAQTSGSVPMRTVSGTIVGSASSAVVNGYMNVTVVLQGAAPLTSYTICVSSPYPGATYGQCAFATTSYYPGIISAGCLGYTIFGCTTGGQTAVIYTDANGNGQVVLQAAGVLPTAVVTATNSSNPNDASQATLTGNGGTASPCFGC